MITPAGFNRAVAYTPVDAKSFDGAAFSTTGATKPIPCDAIWCNATGNINLIFQNGATGAFASPAAGSLIPVRAVGIASGSTTTTGTIYVLYYV